MLTLHNATEEAKILAKWGLIILGIIIILVLSLPFFQGAKEYFFPTEVALPTAEFGKLPHINFPKNSLQKDFTYTINTLSGELPIFPDRIDVFPIAAPAPNLLALERAKERVSDLGFTSQPTPLNDTLYQWSDTSALQRKLDLDILSFNLTLSSAALSQIATTSAITLPFDTEAVSSAKEFVTQLSSFPQDINEEKTKILYYAITDGGLTEVTKKADAQMLRVIFFQKDLFEYPIYYPNPPLSTMKLIVTAGTQSQPTVTDGVFIHHNTSSPSATYAIKTTQQAFDILKNKQGYIASHTSSSQAVTITNVSLGYFAPETSQGYLLPIVVFEGDNNFLAYVEAIRDNWLTNQ